MADVEETVRAELCKVANMARREVAEEIAQALLNSVINGNIKRADIRIERAMAIAREIGSKEVS